MNWRPILRCGVVPLLVGTGILAWAAPSGAATAKGTPTATGTRSGVRPLVPVTPRVHGLGRSGIESSLNWAGYAVTGPKISSVSGSWHQPPASCPKNKTQLDATWVGIDGFASSDHTVEQIGTDSDCTKVRRSKTGAPFYYAWYEMYPASAVILPTATYPVHAGDAISASVTVSGSAYTLTLDDAGRWHYSVTQTPGVHPLDVSAEWITEAPTLCVSRCAVSQLADFGALSLTGAYANGLPISSPSFASTQIDMANRSGHKAKALTSALLAGGTAFTITWVHK